MSDIRAVTCNETLPCSECGDHIVAGDVLALYIERGMTGYPPKEFRIRRYYCVTCAKHLKDSITTTEEVA